MSKTITYKNLEDFNVPLNTSNYESWLDHTKTQLVKEIIKTRKKLKLSQSALASKLNTTQSVVSRLESGATNSITLDYLMKIATQLNICSTVKIKIIDDSPSL